MTTDAAAPTTPSLQDRVREIFSAFEAQGARGATGSSRYLLKLGGNATGAFVLEITPDGVRWTNDDGAPTDATIRIDTGDFLAIADGSLDGRLALASEKIELEGDLDAAAKLLGIFFPADSDA